jgi:DNA-binding transcriptional LysR family regulator
MAVVTPWDARIGKRLRLRDLYILSAVVERGSMAKAAKHLAMSQPAISEAIANLEAVLHVRLLDRGPRGVEPTIYAEALLKRGLVVFDELRQGIKDIEFLVDPTLGEVRIGCPEALMAGLVPAVIDRMSRKHPHITFYLQNADVATQHFRELRERSVDLLLGRLIKPLVDEDIDAETLCQDEYLVVAGARSPWAQRRKVTLADLHNEPWISYPPNNIVSAHLAQAFQVGGLGPPRTCVTSFSLHARLHLLATGRFVTILAGMVLRHHARRWGLKALPINLDALSAPFAAFKLKHRTLNPAVRSFLDHTKAVASSADS